MSVSLMKTLFSKTVEIVQPHRRIPQVVKLLADNNTVEVSGRQYRLSPSDVESCYIVGFGKAVSGMARALEEILGPRLKRGIISVPKGSQDDFRATGKKLLFLPPNSKVEVCEGAVDNIPDADALASSKRIVSLVQGLESKDLLFVLISGGGSALLPLPSHPITLAEKAALIRDLSRAGATIEELNSVRKRLSDVKGGKLALLARDTPTVALILSDIIGDPLDLISSSPTVRNVDSRDLAEQILAKYGVTVADSVRQVLSRQCEHVGEDSFAHVQNVLIGNIDLAVDGLVAECESEGFSALKGSSRVSGEAKTIGRLYANLAYHACIADDGEEKRIQELLLRLNVRPEVVQEFLTLVGQLRSDSGRRTVCLINGGETTVQVLGNGKGGRNQELTLAFAQEFHSLCSRSPEGEERRKKFDVFFMSAGTDGIDGPTSAAGAIAYGDLMEDARRQGLDVEATLRNNDSNTFFSRLNNGRELLTVGHTGTNVMDIHMLSICAK